MSGRSSHADSMRHLKLTSGWHLFHAHFQEQADSRLKRVLNLETPEAERNKAIIEYAMIRRVIDWPDQLINEETLNG